MRYIKCLSTFNIYLCIFVDGGVDFDGDQYIGKEDLERVITAITRNALVDEEVSYICNKVYACVVYYCILY